MTTAQTKRPPSKPWRVEWPSVVNGNPNSEDYSSQRAAYEAVRSITGLRVKATVYHWVQGVWVLYEHCEPIATEGEAR